MLHFCHLRLKYHCIIMKCEYKNQNFGKEKLKKKSLLLNLYLSTISINIFFFHFQLCRGE